MKLSYCAARVIREVLPDVVERLVKDKMESDKFRQKKTTSQTKASLKTIARVQEMRR